MRVLVLGGDGFCGWRAALQSLTHAWTDAAGDNTGVTWRDVAASCGRLPGTLADLQPGTVIHFAGQLGTMGVCGYGTGLRMPESYLLAQLRAKDTGLHQDIAWGTATLETALDSLLVDRSGAPSGASSSR